MSERLTPIPEQGRIEQHEKLFELRMAAESISSSDHRERNEDAVFIKTETGQFGVCDGLGGSPAGDLASRAAILQLTRSALQEAVTNAENPMAHQKAIEAANTFLADISQPLTEAAVRDAGRTILKRMSNAIATLCESSDPVLQKTIIDYAIAQLPADQRRTLDPLVPADLELIRAYASNIGTTVSFAKIWSHENGKKFVTTFQLGDSSIYRLRNNVLEKLTVDDSFITSLQNATRPNEEAKLLMSEAEYEQQTPSLPNRPDYTELQVSKNDIINMTPPDHSLIYLVSRLPETQLTVSVLEIRRFVTAHMNNKLKGALIAKPTTSEVLSGDVLVAMTDGITDNLTHGEMRNIIERYKHDPDQLVMMLAAYASKRAQDPIHPRSKPDDMTAAAVVVG